MKKELYYHSDYLQKKINWEHLDQLEPISGGHDDFMVYMFKDSVLLAHVHEGTYSGDVITLVYHRESQQYILYSDYFGSCSGCDAFEANRDDRQAIHRLIIGICNDAMIFRTIDDVITFLKDPEEYSAKYVFDDENTTEILRQIDVAKVRAYIRMLGVKVPFPDHDISEDGWFEDPKYDIYGKTDVNAEGYWITFHAMNKEPFLHVTVHNEHNANIYEKALSIRELANLWPTENWRFMLDLNGIIAAAMFDTISPYQADPIIIKK